MVGLPDGKKALYIHNRLDRIPACDGQTDGRTDILSRHSPRYAYASRGKNKLFQPPLKMLNPLSSKAFDPTTKWEVNDNKWQCYNLIIKIIIVDE